MKQWTVRLRIIQKYFIIISLSSAIISFIHSYCNFNLDFLCLVDSVATSGVDSGVGSVASSGVDSHIRSLSNFFIRNKLLRTFSLALKNNPKLFLKKLFFQLFLCLYQNSLIQ